MKRILVERAALGYPRTHEILARFPDAEQEEVASHWNIPGLHGNAGLAAEWLRVKRDVLVLGVRKTVPVRANGRSADFIAPGASNGCAMACAYCYVPRRKGYANPITTFVNIDAIAAAIRRHAAALPPKTPLQTDPHLWVYDIGENGDASVDAVVSDNVRDLVALFREIPNAKASFATKSVNRDLLAYDPRGKTRVRFSLMPHDVARVVDVRTSPMSERIRAIDDFVDAGYEVHVNLSPVILHEGWLESYEALLRELDDTISDRAKRQLKAEVIFLTHNEALHDVNLGWHPRAEELLWTPATQERKTSETGGANVRYRTGFKGAQVRALRGLIARVTPYLEVRYAF